jgi:ABC-type multidrug transport system fused ATPase/permease subunit
VQGGDIHRIAWLCAGLLGVSLLSAALKFALNFRLSVLGERIVLLLRERLYANYVSDAGTSASYTPKRGTLVTMLSAESEAVGAFAGSAIASPLMQVGTLISVIAFIFASQPWLGVLALGIVVPQAGIVLAVQRHINHRVRERVQALRDASDRISESDLIRLEDEIGADFRKTFAIRRRIFFLKLSSKFALSAISVAGAVGVLFLGGWLVLHGRTDVGTVVARARQLLPERQHGARAVCDARAGDHAAARWCRLTNAGAERKLPLRLWIQSAEMRARRPRPRHADRRGRALARRRARPPLVAPPRRRTAP